MVWDGKEKRTKKKLLYLDDDVDYLKLFSVTGESLGFSVKTVSYASDFIKEFETGTYYVAFVDFILSFSDGLCITRLLHRDKAPDTKLFIYTAFDQHIVTSKVNGDKINGVLSKTEGISKTLAEVVNV